MADSVAPALILGQAFGRFGNFMNGDAHGRPTDMPWGIVFPPGSIAGTEFPRVPLHPTMLYELAINFGIFLLLWLYLKERKTQRTASYSPPTSRSIQRGRFVVEHFRADSPYGGDDKGRADGQPRYRGCRAHNNIHQTALGRRAAEGECQASVRGSTSSPTGRPKDLSGFLEKIDASLAGGARLIQLREKDLSAKTCSSSQRLSRQRPKDTERASLINERADIALVASADGVHITGTGYAPFEAREDTRSKACHRCFDAFYR